MAGIRPIPRHGLRAHAQGGTPMSALRYICGAGAELAYSLACHYAREILTKSSGDPIEETASATLRLHARRIGRGHRAGARRGGGVGTAGPRRAAPRQEARPEAPHEAARRQLRAVGVFGHRGSRNV